MGPSSNVQRLKEERVQMGPSSSVQRLSAGGCSGELAQLVGDARRLLGSVKTEN